MFKSDTPTNTPAQKEIIDSNELASRLQIPESWVRNHTRPRTPKEDRIPCVRLGRYVRFEWGSPQLEQWLANQRHQKGGEKWPPAIAVRTGK